jgi:AcrR family transcriptional regulator
MLPDDLVEIGHDLEAVVLNRAVRWHAEHRVFVTGQPHDRAAFLTVVTAHRKRRAGTHNKPVLGREDWVRAARAALIREGINAVNVLPLSSRLRVTRGGFYWHFKDRADLLDALLTDWEANNTAGFEHVLNEGGHNGPAEFEGFRRRLGVRARIRSRVGLRSPTVGTPEPACRARRQARRRIPHCADPPDLP